jgi:hypothetical protein
MSGSQLPGKSIFRRVYLKSEINVPPFHQKLRYWFPKNGTHVLLHAASTKNNIIYPKVARLESYGGNVLYEPGNGMPDSIEFERDKWYYIEEEFKAESSPGAADGAYRLWFSKSGEENISTPPLVNVTGLTLPVLDRTTLWGNFQHTVHSYGHWYIDDIKISDTRVGPTLYSGKNISPPMHPITK